jgi:hypothetical protein
MNARAKGIVIGMSGFLIGTIAGNCLPLHSWKLGLAAAAICVVASICVMTALRVARL